MTDKTPHYKRTSCRACGSSRLRLFLPLGLSPLGNSFLRSPQEFEAELFFPLEVYFCDDCSLVQLLDVVDPELMFRDYIYVSRTSDTFAAHNSQYARTLVDLLSLRPTDLVVEIGSNDGSLLKCYQESGPRTLGIEPATNIAELACAGGVETLNWFFNSSTARAVRQEYGPASVVTANNVLAHVDDPQDFLAGCRELLSETGLLAVEVPYVRDLIERLEYDTIYHEHLSYFSVSTLLRLCERLGLAAVRMDYLTIHGGSLRLYAGRQEHWGAHAAEVLAWSHQEHELGLDRHAYYEDFAAQVDHHRRKLLDLLTRLRTAGKSVAGYGAPAKLLLNHCGIDAELLPYTVDKNPLKVGRYTPGRHIPVLPVSAVLERQPDYLLILAWNFADEIMRQQEAYRVRGGQFILPIPEPRIV